MSAAEPRAADFSADYMRKLDSIPVSRLTRFVSLVDLAPNDVVLDVGCGTGTLSQLICSRVTSYVGIDFSKDAIDLAEQNARARKLDNAKFEAATVEAFCASNKDTFTAAFTLDFSGYLDNDKFVETYRAIHVSLKRGGRIYVYAPEKTFFLEYLKARGMVRKPTLAYPYIRTGEETVALVRAAGFENIRLRYVSHYNVLRTVHRFSCVPWLGTHFRAKHFVAAEKPVGPR